MIERLASFILQGRMKAVLWVAFFAAFSMVLPPLGHLSGGGLALVALRRGFREGLLVMMLATLVLGVLGALSHLAQVLVIVFLIVTTVMFWVPTLIAAAVLRSSRSLSLTLTVVGVVAGGVLCAHALIVGDVTVWWRAILQLTVSPVLTGPDSPVPPGDVEKILDGMAMAASGMVAATIVYTAMINIFLGRWLQAMLYNPGGFKEEFLRIHLSWKMAVVALGVLSISSLVGGGLGHFAFNLLLVLVAMFSIQGLSLVHATVQIMGANRGWLMGLYGLMVFLFPQVMIVLSAAGVADSWLNFRRRLSGGQA